ncbi:MAG: polyamine aminopropyltransferase [Rhodospirillales bacterium]
MADQIRDGWFTELLHEEELGQGWTQQIRVDRVLYDGQSDFQDILIFENAFFGKVLVLDGVIQTTERDEPFYHEMLAHVPILAHDQVRDVLIVGGGEGGALREVLRHPVTSATMVDIDGLVIEKSRKYLPGLSNGGFDDARTNLVVGDGIRFVADAGNDSYDVIIVDSTDPIGPGEVLFTEAFYANCRRILRPGGIVVTQNGVAFFQGDSITSSHDRLKPHFDDVTFYLTATPTYGGGFMALGWATDDPSLRAVDEVTLAERVKKLGLETRYYSPAVHRAAFALPPYVRDLIS